MPTTKKGQMAMAILGNLTNDPAMAAAGMIPLQHRDRVQNLGQGFVERGGEFFRIPGYEEALEAAAQRSLASRRQALEESIETGIEKERRLLGMPTRSDASKSRDIASFIPRLEDLAKEIIEGDFDIPTDYETAAGGARKLPLVGEAAAAAIERYGMKPEAIEWLEKGRLTESDVIRLAAGANLTGIEQETAKQWSPWASGLTKKQRVDRIENLINAFGNRAAFLMHQPWEKVTFNWRSPEVEGPSAVDPAAPPASTELSPGWKMRY